MLSHGVSAVSTANVNLSPCHKVLCFTYIYKTSHNYDTIIGVIINILGKKKLISCRPFILNSHSGSLLRPGTEPRVWRNLLGPKTL